jgi:hypothetical protein
VFCWNAIETQSSRVISVEPSAHPAKATTSQKAKPVQANLSDLKRVQTSNSRIASVDLKARAVKKPF